VYNTTYFRNTTVLVSRLPKCQSFLGWLDSYYLIENALPGVKLSLISTSSLSNNQAVMFNVNAGF